MLGCENIEALKARLAKNMLEPQDQPLLGLIELAKLNLDKLLNPQSTQDLKNKLEGAGNYLTREIMRYWSQNKHLQMRFDVRPARPGDPERMRTGTNIWGEVYDTRHFVSTGLGTRSRGFVWFFSFVAWYSQIKHKKENVILLLDEPGLTLHGRAQGDLLRYFETELKPVHQLIYTTHSPFMVDPTHFDRVRIVQDLSIDVERLDDLPPEKQGTKVTQDIFDASDDSLFPLQGALGYDIRAPRSISISSAAVSVGTARSAFFDGVDCSSAFASA
jgi:AAA ATPase domain